MKVVSILIVAAGIPLWGQIDLSGSWTARLHSDWQERGPGPEVVDYLGLPINAEARSRALSYSASMLSLPERQCVLYPPTYMAYGPFGLKFTTQTDPTSDKVVSIRLAGQADMAPTDIWMDGRPHPSSNALHTLSGFTTGTWNGNVLTTVTTHIKAGPLRRNGVPVSDQATVTRKFARHGNHLTMTEIVEDPNYLTEPLVVSRVWELDEKAQLASMAYPCWPEAEIARLDGQGTVPHILPGDNNFVGDMTNMYNLPREAVMGGAETIYPEYRNKLQGTYTAPALCVRYCCGWEGGAPTRSIECIGVGYSTPEAPFGRAF